MAAKCCIFSAFAKNLKPKVCKRLPDESAKTNNRPQETRKSFPADGCSYLSDVWDMLLCVGVSAAVRGRLFCEVAYTPKSKWPFITA